MHTEQLGTYRYTVPDGVFPLGGDTLRLAHFVRLRPGLSVCDFGCGAGALGLLLLDRQPDMTITGLERDTAALAAARANVTNNGLSGRFTVVAGDIAGLTGAGVWPEGMPRKSFALVISNPPYHPADSGKPRTAKASVSENASASADNDLDTLDSTRREDTVTLELLCGAAARLLSPGSRFALSFPAPRLCDLLCTLRASSLEPKRLQMVHHSPRHQPSIVLCEAQKDARPGLIVLPPDFRVVGNSDCVNTDIARGGD